MKKLTKKKQKKTSLKKAKTQKEIKQVVERIQIPAPDMKVLRFTIKGVTPLLIKNLDKLTVIELDRKYNSDTLTKTPTKYLSPKEQYERALYYINGKKGNRYGVPAKGIKETALSTCSTIGGGKVIFKGQVNKLFQIVNMPDGYHCELKNFSKPKMDTRMVRVGPRKIPALAHRPRFDKWEIPLVIEYDAESISAESILNLYNHAGFKVGLCSFRPENKGPMGQFKIV